jgi:hypothetical protein
MYFSESEFLSIPINISGITSLLPNVNAEATKWGLLVSITENENLTKSTTLISILSSLKGRSIDLPDFKLRIKASIAFVLGI